MSTFVVLFFLGYLFHWLYKLFDIGMIALYRFVSKFKKTSDSEKL